MWQKLKSLFSRSGGPDASAPGASRSFDPNFKSKTAFRMVAVDIDGTLLRSDSKLTSEVSQAVSRATAMGVRVVLSSARPPQGVNIIHKALGLDTYQICLNGALICSGSNYKIVHHKPLPPDVAIEAVRLARQIAPKVQIRVDIVDKWYTDTPQPQNKTSNSPLLQPPDGVYPMEQILQQPPSRITFLAPRELMIPIRQLITQRFGTIAKPQYTDDRVLQLVHVGAHKGLALEMVAHHYQINRQDVMAIGDAPNDLEMLNWAGCSVAVANALPEVLESVHLKVSSNNHSGVAEAIVKYALGDPVAVRRTLQLHGPNGSANPATA